MDNPIKLGELKSVFKKAKLNKARRVDVIPYEFKKMHQASLWEKPIRRLMYYMKAEMPANLS